MLTFRHGSDMLTSDLKLRWLLSLITSWELSTFLPNSEQIMCHPLQLGSAALAVWSWTQCLQSSVFIWLHWSATKLTFLDDHVVSLKGPSSGTHSHPMGGILASPCHLWPLMRHICIDVAQRSGCCPSGQRVRVTVIEPGGLEYAVLEKIRVINRPPMSALTT